MPGIFGAYKRNGKEDLGKLMEGMIQSMSHQSAYRVDRFLDVEKGLFAGRISLGILNSIDQPINSPGGEGWIIFHGELYRKQDGITDSVHVLNKYFERGDHCAADLNGIFHFVIYDKRSEQIKLFSDKFGLQPLYYSLRTGGIIFAGEVKALLSDPDLEREPDYQGFADFLHYGQLIGQKTLFKHIKLLPPGSTLTFNLKDHRTTLTSYWQLYQQFAEKGSYDPKATPKDVIAYLVDAIKVRTGHKNLLGLSLSGGLDTRGILAGLGKEADGIFTYTLGLPGCADQKLADSMARVAKTKHEFVELNQEYLGDFESMAQGMIHLSDGMYHPHESTEMLALEYFKRSPFRILLRGHGGEIAKAALAYPIMVAPHVHNFSGVQDIMNYIFETTNLVIRDIVPEQLFTRSFSEVFREGPRRSLQDSCGRASERLTPADLCIYYYINEHIRRQVVASLEIFRTQIEVRMPYLDEDFVHNLLKLPVKYRNTGEVHIELIKQCMTGLVKIPNSNTGAPLDASPSRLWVTDKFNSLMKRLSITGFRHYTEYQKWHRKEFREASQRILFGDRAASRNLYNMDVLKSIFEIHLSGKKNYGHLLGTMVGIELWFRNFVD